MAGVIGIKSYDLSDVPFLYDGRNSQRGSEVTMAKSQASSLTPTTLHPPGTVLIKKTSDGKFYLATDVANCDSPDAASINTLVTNPGSGGWDGDLIISGHWGTITVALSGDDDDAAVATAINTAVAAQDPETQARITAADATGSVSITNFDVGPGTWLHAYNADVAGMFGANGTDDQGNDADVRVTSDFVDLVDLNGTAADAQVPTLRKGNFRTAQLSSLTAEARGILERRGSQFF